MADIKRIAIVGGVVVLGIILFKMNNRDNVAAAINSYDPFEAPYLNEGRQPGAGFNSVLNVSINPDMWAGLANQYMPVFGFVGVGVTGNLPRQITNINTITNTAPPQRVVQAAAPPPVAPVPAPPLMRVTNDRRDGYYDMSGASPRGLTRNLQ